MTAIYYAALFVTGFLGVYSQQKYERTSKGYSDIFVYSFFTGVIAMAFFFCLNGFKIELNARTCVYAVVFAFVVIPGSFTRLTSFKYMDIAESGVLISSMTLVFTAVSGFVFFHEKLTLVSVARVLLMLAAVCVIFLENKSVVTFKRTRGRDIAIGFLLCVGSACVGTASTILSKLFASDSGVTDANSYFFLTNAVIFLFDAAAIFIIHGGSVKGAFSGFLKVKPFGYAMIILSTVTSNIGSILGVLILAADGGGGNVSLYAPLSSAISLISSGLVGYFAARERPNLPAMLLAIMAILLGIFN